jgi:hypothetical protein
VKTLYLAAVIGEDAATMVTDDAIKRFERLLPDLPNVGGDHNVDTQYRDFIKLE